MAEINGWTVFGLIMFAVSAAVFNWAGSFSYAVGAFVSFLLFGALKSRWALSTTDHGAATFMWPFVLLILPFLAVRKERERKLRLVRSVLGS